MPPKPFKPPRPSAALESTSKPKSKVKPTTTSARKSTTPKTKPNGVSKSRSNQAKTLNGKSGKGKDAPRISAASRLSFAGLPSLSPDSEDEREEPNAAGASGRRRGKGSDSDDEDQEEDAEEESSISLSSDEAPVSRRRSSNSASKAKSKGRQPPDEAASPDPEPGDGIPLDLLNVLLHQFYKEDNTRMSKDANRAVGKYMETFVREALARVAYSKGGGEGGGGGGGGSGGEVLEVEDLEKAAPQMLLDF